MPGIGGAESFPITFQTTGSEVLTVTASNGATGSVTTQVSSAARASSIIATSGSMQSAIVGTSFLNALKATVLDQFGNPSGGVLVTFTASATSVGVSFHGPGTTTALTNPLGLDTAPLLTANTATGGTW